MCSDEGEHQLAGARCDRSHRCRSDGDQCMMFARSNVEGQRGKRQQMIGFAPAELILAPAALPRHQGRAQATSSSIQLLNRVWHAVLPEQICRSNSWHQTLIEIVFLRSSCRNHAPQVSVTSNSPHQKTNGLHTFTFRISHPFSTD